MHRLAILVALMCFACAQPLRPEQAPAAREGRAAVPGGEIAYEVTGSGQPLVLLHGGAMDRAMWEPLMPQLTRRYRVIRWDARGHGRSTAPAQPAADTADDLRLMLDSLGIERATIAGFSMGSGTAAHFTVRHPRRVAQLILISTSGPPPGVTPVASAPPPLGTEEGRRRLAATGVPVTVIAGERDSERVRAAAAAIAADVPGARLIVVGGGGHNVVADRPAEVAAAILAAGRR